MTCTANFGVPYKLKSSLRARSLFLRAPRFKRPKFFFNVRHRADERVPGRDVRETAWQLATYCAYVTAVDVRLQTCMRRSLAGLHPGDKNGVVRCVRENGQILHFKLIGFYANERGSAIMSALPAGGAVAAFAFF